MVVTTKGVILKRRNIGERDAILTILTDELGLIEASARGVKQTKSKLAAGVQPFYYSEISLLKNRERYIVTGAEALETFHKLRYDVIKVALADYIAELICALTPADEMIQPVKRLYLNALYLLSEEKKTPAFIKPVVELRLLALAGFMPDLVCCRQCSAHENTALYLDLRQGYLLCEKCKTSENMSDFAALTPSVLAALRHIIYTEDEKLFNFTVSSETLKLLNQITERYTLYHMERSFRSLEIYRSLSLEDDTAT